MSRNSLIEYFRKNDKWYSYQLSNRYGYYDDYHYYHYSYNIVRATDKEIQSAAVAEIMQADEAKQNIFHYLFTQSAYLQLADTHALSSLVAPKHTTYYVHNDLESSAFFNHLQQQEQGLQFSTITAVGKQRLAAISKSLIDKLSLEQKFAVLSTRDGQGNTPLHYAIQNCNHIDYFIDLVHAVGQLDAKQQQLILTARNSKDQNILHLLAMHFGPYAQNQGVWNNSALKQGLSARDQDGYTPLHLALLGQLKNPTDNRIQFTQAGLACLMDQKAVTKQKGFTERKHEQKSKESGECKEKAFSINDENRGGYTLTSLACRAGATIILQQLPTQYVQQTAGVKSKRSGMNAFHYAARRGDTALMIELINHYPKDYDLTSLLMEKDNQGRTVLHHACKYGNQAMLTVLLPRLSGQSWQKLASLQDSLFTTAKNSGQGSMLNFSDALNQRFSFYQVYDYLVKREKWLTRSDDYQQRLNDFKQILLHLNQGGSPTEIKSTTFYKKTYFCGLWSGSENYQNHKTQLINSLTKLAEDKSPAEGHVNQCLELTQEFIAFLSQQPDCPVARELIAALPAQVVKPNMNGCTADGEPGAGPAILPGASYVPVSYYVPPPAYNPSVY